jgi:hypothetical protein
MARYLIFAHAADPAISLIGKMTLWESDDVDARARLAKLAPTIFREYGRCASIELYDQDHVRVATLARPTGGVS